MNDIKNKKSFDIMVEVSSLLNEKPDSLYQNKTPGWRKFFKSWARRTMEQDYLETLVNHRLNVTAFNILKHNPLERGQSDDLDIFLKGVIYGVKMLYGDIRKAATKEEIKNEGDK